MAKTHSFAVTGPYSKASVMLAELVLAVRQPVQHFPTPSPVRSARAVTALDMNNAGFSRGTLRSMETGIA